jgi:hypothetical protein
MSGKYENTTPRKEENSEAWREEGKQQEKHEKWVFPPSFNRGRVEKAHPG